MTEEELDDNKKQKVELIKKTSHEKVSSEEIADVSSKTASENHVKKVIIKKRPAHRSKKTPKILTTPRTTEITETETVIAKAEELAILQEAKEPVMESPPVLSSLPIVETPPQASEIKKPAPPEKQVVEKHNGVSSFVGTQRPAVVAGRVGGRSVGPRPPREDRQSKPNTRSGARTGAFHPEFGQNRRPAGQQGYQQGASHSPGGKHSFIPRPAASPGLRSIGPGRPLVQRPLPAATPSTSSVEG